MKRLTVFMVLILIGLVGWRVHTHQTIIPSHPVTLKPSSANPPSSFNTRAHAIDEPGSLWWIVNKKRPLPASYAPTDLVVPDVTLRLSATSEQMHVSKQTTDSLIALFAAAKTAGHPLVLASGYRSASYQAQLYNSYVAKDGQPAADRYSARPGTSEHQTGLAMDICESGKDCSLEQSFGDTPGGRWLASHVAGFGFIIRYPNGKEAITGYEYEPWHLRFVGTDLAKQLQTKNQTMEEFFGL